MCPHKRHLMKRTAEAGLPEPTGVKRHSSWRPCLSTPITPHDSRETYDLPPIEYPNFLVEGFEAAVSYNTPTQTVPSLSSSGLSGFLRDGSVAEDLPLSPASQKPTLTSGEPEELICYGMVCSGVLYFHLSSFSRPSGGCRHPLYA